MVTWTSLFRKKLCHCVCTAKLLSSPEEDYIAERVPGLLRSLCAFFFFRPLLNRIARAQYN